MTSCWTATTLLRRDARLCCRRSFRGAGLLLRLIPRDGVCQIQPDCDKVVEHSLYVDILLYFFAVLDVSVKYAEQIQNALAAIG